MRVIPYFSVSLLLTVYASGIFAAEAPAAKASVAACIGCHGEQGISQSGQIPNLAGQMPAYLSNQLSAFRSSTRKDPTMNGVAANLPESEINPLAAYFAALAPAKNATADAAMVNAGKDKAGMCLGCHGNTGQGQGGFPRLAGQKAEYLVKQLQDFRRGQRRGGAMGAIAGSLSDQAINEIAAYFSSL